MVYTLILSREFLKLSKKKLIPNVSLKNAMELALVLLSINPYDKKLRSHKVNSKNYGICISSRVTGDVRVLWKFSENGPEILNILDFGRHSGTHKVYK